MGEQTLKRWFAHCPDVVFHRIDEGREDDACLVFFCESMCNREKINEMVIPRLISHRESLMFIEMDKPWSEKKTAELLFRGHLLIHYAREDKLVSLQLGHLPKREPEESNAENTTLGARDGFVEELTTNIALIRKRLLTNDLRYESFQAGGETPKKVALLYMASIADRPYLIEARRRLSDLGPDPLTTSSQLEERIADSPFSLFPLLTYTGRPDFAVECLLRDRFILVLEANPIALIGPANFMLLMKSPEDLFFSYALTIFGRLVRLVSLWISIFLPGFWVSLVTYNQDQIPFPLLATITVSRIGLPLSAPLEMFLSMLLLEMFREAGVRLPRAIGQTITVVGGIIIGEAAIRAGLISPSMIVITALTAVATSTLVNTNLSGNIVLLRISIFVVSSMFGMFGLIMSVLFLVWYLSNLRSFGVPYLSPISPLVWRDVLAAVAKLPVKLSRRHPAMLNKSKRRP